MVEVIRWPIGEDAVASYAFDPQTHRLLEIVVLDKPTRKEATIMLSDYRDVGGLHWPCMMEVRSDGMTYRDTLSNWRVVP